MFTRSFVFIVVIIGFLITLFFLLRQMTFRIQRRLNPGRLKWLWGGYSLVLVMALVLYYLLPVGEDLTSEPTLEGQATAAYFQLMEAIHESDLSKLDKNYLQREWQWETDAAEVKITTAPNQEWDNTQLVVVQGEETADEIVAQYYITPTLVAEVDFTDYIPPPEVQLRGKELQITFPTVEIKGAFLAEEPPIAQFNTHPDERSGHVTFGASALVIYLPPQTEIFADQSFPLHVIN